MKENKVVNVNLLNLLSLLALEDIQGHYKQNVCMSKEESQNRRILDRIVSIIITITNYYKFMYVLSCEIHGKLC